MLYHTSGEKKFTTKSVISVFAETYPLYGESGSKNLTEEDYEYHSQLLVAVTSFLNISNRKRLSRELSILDVLKNVIAWDIEDEKNKTLPWSTILLALPRMTFQAFEVMAALPSSTAKLVVEFLPGLAEEACYIGKTTEQNPMLLIVYQLGHFIFSAIHLAGYILTPSIKGWFPMSGDDSIFKLLNSVFLYYGILLLIAATALIALTVVAFHFSTVAFALLLVIEAGLACGLFMEFTREPEPHVSSIPEGELEHANDINQEACDKPDKKSTAYGSFFGQKPPQDDLEEEHEKSNTCCPMFGF